MKKSKQIKLPMMILEEVVKKEVKIKRSLPKIKN